MDRGTPSARGEELFTPLPAVGSTQSVAWLSVSSKREGQSRASGVQAWCSSLEPTLYHERDLEEVGLGDDAVNDAALSRHGETFDPFAREQMDRLAGGRVNPVRRLAQRFEQTGGTVTCLRRANVVLESRASVVPRTRPGGGRTS